MPSAHTVLGPMGSACMQIRVAGERFAAEQAARRATTSLLRRSDDLLAALEDLNMRRVRMLPDPVLSGLAALLADVPFEHGRTVGGHTSPSRAIEVVFDVQEGLLRAMRGIQPDEEIHLQMAS
jgi:hypothetical protein